MAIPLAAIAASPLVSKVAEGGLSLLGSLFGAHSQRKSTQDTNAQNLQIARETNANQLAIARENNAMQFDAMREQNAFNRQQAIDMFNLEAAYNDPSAQKARLIAAGLNPATMYGGSATAASGNVDASVPSASGSGISPSNPSLTAAHMETPPGVMQALFGNLQSFTQSMLNLSNSKLSNAEKDRIKLLMNSELQSIISSTKSTEAQTEYQNLQTQFERLFGSAKRGSEVQKNIQEAHKLYEEAMLAAAKGETEKTQQWLNQADEVLKKAQTSTVLEQLPFIRSTAIRTAALLEEQINTQKSIQSANYASAALSSAEAAAVPDRLQAEIKKFSSEVDRNDAEKLLTDVKREIENINKDARNAALKMLLNELSVNDALEESFLRKIINRVFGVDIQSLSGALPALIGAFR